MPAYCIILVAALDFAAVSSAHDMKGKLCASAAGLAAAVLLLEAVLRLGGCALAWGARWHSWTMPAGAYRILCLGESTTRRQYPKPLEDILNERGQGRRFVVIDGGVGIINTNYVVAHLAENLARYQPDLVVAMIGSNDRGVAYLKDVTGTDTWLFGHSRAFRLAVLLGRAARARLSGGAGDGIPDLPPPGWGDGASPGTAREHHLRQGALLLDFGRVRAAAALLGLACREAPQDPEAWLLMTRLELTRRQPEAARRCLGRAEAAGAGRAELRAAWGRYHAAQGDWSAARSAFRQALALRPADLRAREGLADVLAHEGKVREAEEEYLSMAREAPQDPERWFTLGRFYRAQGRHGEAAAALRRGLRLDPGRPQAWNLLAQSFRLDGHPAAAEKLYRGLLRRWPALFASRTGLYAAMVDQGKDNMDGSVDFQEYVLREPHDVRDLSLLAARRGQWLHAEAWIRQAVAREPWNPAGHANLGMILSAPVLARYGEAQRELRRAFAIDPDGVPARLVLAQLLYRQRRWAEAAAQYREVLARRPTHPAALGGLALVYEQLRRPGLLEEARRRADEAVGAQSAPMTRENYLKMKALLDRRGVGLVAVQYPMRSVEPLRRILAGAAGVTFVDNERSFREAVAREGYFAFFIDNFAGDFGHCNAKGNRLLASNIADAVLARLAGPAR